MIKKLNVYDSWKIERFSDYILENGVIYKIKYKDKEVFGSINNEFVKESIENRKFTFKNSLKREFIKKYKKELTKFKDEYIERTNNLSMSLLSYEQFFEIRKDIGNFLFHESRLLFSKYFIDIKKVKEFLRGKEEYFCFYIKSKDDYDKVRVYPSDKENEMFLRYHNLEEGIVYMGQQIEGLKNKIKELEEEKFIFYKGNYKVGSYGKKDTNRRNRKKLRQEIKKANNLEEISNYKIPKDTWKYV